MAFGAHTDPRKPDARPEVACFQMIDHGWFPQAQYDQWAKVLHWGSPGVMVLEDGEVISEFQQATLPMSPEEKAFLREVYS